MTMKKMSDITRKVIISFFSPVPFLILPLKCVKKPKKKIRITQDLLDMIFFFAPYPAQGFM